MAKFHIPLSGAQGGGKTSLLNELESRGYTVDRFKVSRAVQEQLGWDSLERVMDRPETMMQFQQAVFEQKLLNDSAFVYSSNTVILTERSFADIAAYTTSWMWKFVDRGDLTLGEAMEWLTPYLSKCRKRQAELYNALIIVPLMSHIPWDNDPHRAKKEDAQAVFDNLTRFMDNPVFIGYPKLTISAKTVSDRADEVEAFIRTLK